MTPLTDISAELLELFQALDDALSRANNSVLAAAIPDDESLADFGLLIAAVQNLLCDYHMFLVIRLSELQIFDINPELVVRLGERFNRIDSNQDISAAGRSLRAELERSGRRMLDLLLCLDRDSFRSIPSDSGRIPEYLMRTLALERDLAWAQEFHIFPQLTGHASAPR